MIVRVLDFEAQILVDRLLAEVGESQRGLWRGVDVGINQLSTQLLIENFDLNRDLIESKGIEGMDDCEGDDTNRVGLGSAGRPCFGINL